MKTTKTILSLLLVLALAASISAMPVFADGENANGDSNQPTLEYSVLVESQNNGNETITQAKVLDQIIVSENSTPQDCYGVEFTYSDDTGTPALTVNGNIQTEEYRTALTVSNSNSSTPVAVEVKGSVAGMDGGVFASTEMSTESTTTTVDIQGDVTVIKPTGTHHGGVGVEAKNSTVNVQGSVINNSNMNAVKADGSYANVTVKNVTSNGEGVAAVSADDGAQITVKGSVTSNDSAVVADRKAEVLVEGNVTAKGTGVVAGNGATVEVKNNVTADDKGITATAGSGDAVVVTVGGDVSSKDTGVLINLEDSSSKETDITIEGTLKVEEGGTPILLGSGVTADNVEITVWKIEVGGKAPEEGKIVQAAGDDDSPGMETEEEQTKEAADVENKINYIIRIHPDSADKVSSPVNTAHANDTVKITVTVPAGKRLTAVYADDGRSLTADDNGDGTFTLKVPVGGGVYVYADLEDEPTPPKPVDNGLSYTAVAKTDKVEVTFDPAGGAWSNGKTDPIVKNGCWDTWFQMPELPVREDYRCAGWQCDDGDITASQPGQNFCPYKGGDYGFVAVWEEE